MIIAQQTQGSSLSDLVVDEVTFQTETGATGVEFFTFEYDGNDWQKTYPAPSATVNIADYGITYTGTPINTDIISIAYQPTGADMFYFSVGKGINQTKLNANFANTQQEVNTNETNINNIANTALLKDGSNITQTMIDAFQQQTPIILSGDGNINLTDNKVHFLTLTGNNTNQVVLPTPASDGYSHTIILIVDGSNYSLNVANGTTGPLMTPVLFDSTNTYTVMYVYNKIDNGWYYAITQ